MFIVDCDYDKTVRAIVVIKDLPFGQSYWLETVWGLDYDFNKGMNTRIGARSVYCLRKHNKLAQWLASESPKDINRSQTKESKISSRPAKTGENATQEKIKQRLR